MWPNELLGSNDSDRPNVHAALAEPTQLIITVGELARITECPNLRMAEMALGNKRLLGGRYKLTGALARADSVQRGWDRWLNRQVFIEILSSHEIDNCDSKGRFIASARALVQMEHPNVEALLDYGVTDAGAPYHVMAEAGVDLASLMAREGRVSWARARGILLDVIAGVAALHRRRIVHGGIAPHSVALVGDTARLVEFGQAKQLARELSAADISVDVHGIAALGFLLLTGLRATGRATPVLEAALARIELPRSVRALLLRALSEPHSVELASLQRAIAGKSCSLARTRLIDAAAAVAAVAMLTIGLWSSVASSSAALGMLDASADANTAKTCEQAFESVSTVELRSRSVEPIAQPSASAPPIDSPAISQSAKPIASQSRFESARAHLQVGAEQRRRGMSVRSDRFELHGELSPAKLVERGIDLTHGRPTPQDDPRLPIVDGPIRARALFEAACARDYGKGCHMLGVQIAEGMIPDDRYDGSGAAEHYRRGCALDYHRSCAALADLARAGRIVADADLLEAKACLLAGPNSSYCRLRE